MLLKKLKSQLQATEEILNKKLVQDGNNIDNKQISIRNETIVRNHRNSLGVMYY